MWAMLSTATGEVEGDGGGGGSEADDGRRRGHYSLHCVGGNGCKLDAAANMCCEAACEATCDTWRSMLNWWVGGAVCREPGGAG